MSIASSVAKSVARPVARAVSAVGDGAVSYSPLTNLALDSLTAAVAISPQYLGGTTGQAWADARLPTVNVEKGYGSAVFQDLYPDPTTGELFTQPDGAGVTAMVFADGENLLVQTPYNQSLADTVTGHPTPISDDRRVLLDISVPTSPSFAGKNQGTQDASQHATERGYDLNISVTSNLGVSFFTLDSAVGSTDYRPYQNNGGTTQYLLVNPDANKRWYDNAVVVENKITPTTLPNFKSLYVPIQETAPTRDVVIGLQGGWKQGSGSSTTTGTSTPMRVWGPTGSLTGRAFMFALCNSGVVTHAQAYQVATRSHVACKGIFGANDISLYGPKIYQGFPIDLTANTGTIYIQCASAASREIEASFDGGAYVSIGTTDANGYLSGSMTGVTPGIGTLNLRVVGQVGVAASVTNIAVGVFVAALGQSNALGRGDDYTLASVGTRQSGGTWTALGVTDKSWIAKFADDLSVAESAPFVYQNVAIGGSYLYRDLFSSTDGRFGEWAYNNSGLVTTNEFATAARNSLLWYGNANFIIWHQGESEAVDGITDTKYKTSLVNMWTEFKARTGQAGKLWVMQIGRDGAVADANVDTIRKALVDVVSENPTLFEFGGCLAHLAVEDAGDSGQLVHFYTTAQKDAVVAVFKRHALGAGRGPRYSSMTASGTSIVIQTTGGVTPLTVSGGEAASPIGWTVTDGSGSKTVTAVAVSNLQITLTTSGAALTGTVTVKWLSHYSGIGTTLLDSDATTPVPPEPFSESVAAT